MDTGDIDANYIGNPSAMLGQFMKINSIMLLY